MFVKQCEEFADLLVKKNNIPQEKKNLVAHGISVMIELGLNISTTVLLGLMFNLVIESIVFIISYSFIRMYTNGFHCKTSRGCYIFSCGIVIIVLTLIKFVFLEDLYFSILVLVSISVPIILSFAPLSTKTRILDEAEKTYFRKVTVRNLIIEIVIILVLLLLNLQRYAFLISLSIFVATILLIVQKAINIKYRI